MSIQSEIYDRMWSVLTTDSTFDYIVTKQKGYYPKAIQLISSNLFPWAFIEYESLSPIEPYRLGGVFNSEYALSLIVMTHADRGNQADLIFNSGGADSNVNKGIGDIVDDIIAVYYGKWKRPNFGVSGIIDWTITRAGIPQIPQIVRLMVENELIRAIQVDFRFKINWSITL